MLDLVPHVQRALHSEGAADGKLRWPRLVRFLLLHLEAHLPRILFEANWGGFEPRGNWGGGFEPRAHDGAVAEVAAAEGAHDGAENGANDGVTGAAHDGATCGAHDGVRPGRRAAWIQAVERADGAAEQASTLP